MWSPWLPPTHCMQYLCVYVLTCLCLLVCTPMYAAVLCLCAHMQAAAVLCAYMCDLYYMYVCVEYVLVCVCT